MKSSSTEQETDKEKERIYKHGGSVVQKTTISLNGDSAEKQMSYRKRVDSDADLSDESPLESENTSQLPSENKSSETVSNQSFHLHSGPWWLKEKKFIIDTLDKFNPH